MPNHFKASLESLGRKVSALHAKAIQEISFSYSVPCREQKLIIIVCFIGQSFMATAGGRNTLCACTHNSERG